MTLSEVGPLVVSPPISSTPYSFAHEKKPFENSFIHNSFIFLIDKESKAYLGVPPIAEISEILVAKTFQPNFLGAWFGKKCVPSFIVSWDNT